MGFFTGTSGSDTLTGRPNEDDQVYGFDGDDTLSGDSGADFLHGGNGADVLTGGAGGDALFGGTGADAFVYLNASDSSQASGIDTLIDFETGIDRIDLRALSVTAASILQRQGGGSYLFVTTSTGQTLTLNSNQTLFAGDLLMIQAVGVHVGGTSASETLNGTINADILYGQGGSDTLLGGAGDDILNGGAGGDTLIGGAGFDSFLYLADTDSNAATGYDNIADFQTGADRLDLRNIALTGLNIVRQTDGSAIVFVNTNAGGLVLLSGSTINTADLLLPFDPVNGIVDAGSSAGETFVGAGIRDIVYGLGGNDVIFGNDGNDILFGGDGDDVMYGGRGNDRMDGSGGRDVFAWREYEGLTRSSDSIALFTGADDRVRFEMLDIVSISLNRSPFGTEIDVIGLGGTTLYLVLTTVVNGQDLEFLRAPLFINLTGSVGNDTLIGGAFNEIITGGGNFDNLTGGGGRDTFRYNSATDSQGAFADFITDFTSGQDLLDLRPLGSNIVVNFVQSGNTMHVFVDVDANGTNDMQIRLTGVTALTPNDFLFTGRFGSQPAAAPIEPESAPMFEDAGVPDAVAPWLHPTHGDWMLVA
ncbi:Mannuronan C5-epimerase AlgE5 [Brevundimonas sp. NIBR10]|uniref:calcium-binding protein n=1 Tax=Brevundimonas sp. NIBR10 TaxID=3015997 RepID=UPI0022F17D0A|nr:M10 family metallopeptidase C-terminal domain-containing protein [Brevundimonas sp. NIBR10]WGM46020.1 Mannuronan C5-epimerase AlgE5 [Brevundimonas sp. NIBR10]